MGELKPCPFCGGKAKIMRKGSRSGKIRSYSVDCPECLANGPVFWVADWHRTPFIAQEKAVRAWNKRKEDESEWVNYGPNVDGFQ